MPTVYLLCGLSGSGKTTTAKKIAEEHNAVRFTLDERMIHKYTHSIYDEAYGILAKQEKELIWQEAQSILQKGQDVILDWSLWSQQARQEWTQKILQAGYTYHLYYLATPLDTIKQRLTSRNQQNLPGTHSIPFTEVERFTAFFEPPNASEGLHMSVIQAS